MKVLLEHDEHLILAISRVVQAVVTLVVVAAAVVVASQTCCVAFGQVRAENADDGFLKP